MKEKVASAYVLVLGGEAPAGLNIKGLLAACEEEFDLDGGGSAKERLDAILTEL